jgi:hypothetical protein
MLASQPRGWGPDYQAAESGLQCIGSDPTTSHSPSTYIFVFCFKQLMWWRLCWICNLSLKNVARFGVVKMHIP